MLTVRKLNDLVSAMLIVTFTLFGAQPLPVSAQGKDHLKREQNAQTGTSSTNGMDALLATTWYVATTGNDGSDCATNGSPCLTINGVLAKVGFVAGDTVLVVAGTYTGSGTEAVLIDKSVTISGGWNASFTTQDGTSTIDGQSARRGVTVNNNITTSLDRFIIKNGLAPVVSLYGVRVGGGIYNQGTLTLNSSQVNENTADLAGGIFNNGTLVLNGSSVSNNTTTGSGGGIYNTAYNAVGIVTLNNSSVNDNVAMNGAGGGISTEGVFTLNSSTVSNNTVYTDGLGGGGIAAFGSLILDNSTISGNATNTVVGGCPGAANSLGGGIFGYSGTVNANNSTIVYNTAVNCAGDWGNGGGISTYQSVINLKNTIIAGNTASLKGSDCFTYSGYSGSIVSSGYNLIGNNSDCTFTPTTGDLVGTNADPINPLLGPLQDNGGLTFTHALWGGSPAINAGNLAVPGSGGTACLATDQRGVPRPVSTACDVGAFEGYLTRVVSIKRVNPSPASASLVDFTVIFSEEVTGVDTIAPISDFVLTTTGVTDASISAVTGSGDTYMVSVNTGSGNGTIRLDVVDNDSILDTSDNPLAGTGSGNGNFTSGETYTLLRIPTPKSPTSTISDTTPTYKWSKIPGATKYQYQLWKGTTLVYAKIVASSVCGAATCSHTPTTILTNGIYKWRVEAMTGGVWKSYSVFKSFTLFAPKAGFWSGPGLEFYVTPNQMNVDNFAIYITVTGCGSYKITHTPLAPIANKHFAFSGSFHASGNFSTAAKASGLLGLTNFYIPGCGYITGGPFSWSATWKNVTQPVLLSIDKNMKIFVEPAIDVTPSGFYIIESVDR